MIATHRRTRQCAIFLVFALSVFATAATSPAYTTIQLDAATDTLHLDAEHPAALARIVVKVNPEATSGVPSYSVRLRIGSVMPEAGGTRFPFDVAVARFIVTAAVPGEPMPGSELPGPSEARTPGPRPTVWQAEARFALDVSLPIQCGAGPCERAFWLVAQLVDGQVGAVSVDWQVEGSLGFTAQTWPSGAGGSIAIDPPISVAGPVAQLVATTEPEQLRLGPTTPAAARVVEVKIGADAITGDGSSVGTMSVDLFGRSGSGTSYEQRPIVSVYPLLGMDDSSNAGALPEPFGSDADPFQGCERGVDCVRRFLVTFAWNGVGGQDQPYDWNLRVRRLDLIRAWSTPVELSATIQRRIDIAANGAPQVIHLEGDEQSVPNMSDPQIAVGLKGSTTADEPIARLLPVPAVLTYRWSVARSDPAATPERTIYSEIVMPGARSGNRVHLSLFDGETAAVVNPLAGCRIGDACQDVKIWIVRQAPLDKDPLAPLAAHWSLDLLTYSYVDIPVELSVDQRP